MRLVAIGGGLVSVALHGALAVATTVAPRKAPPREATAITIQEAPPPPAKAPPPPPPPPVAPPPPTPAPVAKAPAAPPPSRVAPKPAATAAPAAPATPAAPPAPFDATGLGGDVGGGGGVDVPRPPAPVAPPPAPATPPKKKVLTAPAPAADGGCTEPIVKPKPIKVVQPAFTQEAQDAQITGKVRVEIAIAADGTVEAVKVIEGLGYGLDEAALAAAKASTFTPATRCGTPVATTFVIGMRFTR
ncbi:MAG TPA: TonB family protein [Kofleriaceae bacterium]|nr:TonB family protein [Kofleriaceae bacterium]